MFPPFPEERAKAFCLELIRAFEREKRIDFEVSADDANAALSVDHLFKDGGGQMFGVCVCADSTGAEVVLKAFSGQYNSVWDVPGWVPPLLDTDEFARTTLTSDRLIHELTDKIERAKAELTRAEAQAAATPNSKPQPHTAQNASHAPAESMRNLKALRRNLSALQKERKSLSRTSMKEIFALYRFFSFVSTQGAETASVQTADATAAQNGAQSINTTQTKTADSQTTALNAIQHGTAYDSKRGEQSDSQIGDTTQIQNSTQSADSLTAALNTIQHGAPNTQNAATDTMSIMPNLVSNTAAIDAPCAALHTESHSVSLAIPHSATPRSVSPITFADIFPPNKQPPTGCGECCAPKLLSFAAEHNLTPLSLAEFYYGNENNSGTKKHGSFYPPCDEKCALILPHILGLNIVYRDDAIIVINKPSGLLSIPGRGAEKADSATTRLKRLFPDCIAQPSVHRLDMDTSGLLVMAFTAEAHRALSIQFMEGTVQKKYIAVLRNAIHVGSGCMVTEFDAQNNALAGRIELPFRLDTEHRPYQIYDAVHGKLGITDWRVLSADDERIAKSFDLSPVQIQNFVKNDCMFVEFSPKTGRTHQLRTHSAHPKGLASAIVGDNLYGTQNAGERLMLHACFLRFTHPVTGEVMQFEV